MLDRKEAKKICNQVENREALVNIIYDVFEHRSCESCNQFGEWEREIPGAEDFTTTGWGCLKFRQTFEDGFWCSLWRSKNV